MKRKQISANDCGICHAKPAFFANYGCSVTHCSECKNFFAEVTKGNQQLEPCLEGGNCGDLECYSCRYSRCIKLGMHQRYVRGGIKRSVKPKIEDEELKNGQDSVQIVEEPEDVLPEETYQETDSSSTSCSPVKILRLIEEPENVFPAEDYQDTYSSCPLIKILRLDLVKDKDDCQSNSSNKSSSHTNNDPFINNYLDARAELEKLEQKLELMKPAKLDQESLRELIDVRISELLTNIKSLVDKISNPVANGGLHCRGLRVHPHLAELLSWNLQNLQRQVRVREDELKEKLRQLQKFTADHAALKNDVDEVLGHLQQLSLSIDEADEIRALRIDFKTLESEHVEPLDRSLERLISLGQNLANNAGTDVDILDITMDVQRAILRRKRLVESTYKLEQKLEDAEPSNVGGTQKVHVNLKLLPKIRVLIEKQKPAPLNIETLEVQLCELQVILANLRQMISEIDEDGEHTTCQEDELHKLEQIVENRLQDLEDAGFKLLQELSSSFHTWLQDNESLKEDKRPSNDESLLYSNKLCEIVQTATQLIHTFDKCASVKLAGEVQRLATRFASLVILNQSSGKNIGPPSLTYERFTKQFDAQKKEQDYLEIVHKSIESVTIMVQKEGLIPFEELHSMVQKIRKLRDTCLRRGLLFSSLEEKVMKFYENKKDIMDWIVERTSQDEGNNLLSPRPAREVSDFEFKEKQSTYLDLFRMGNELAMEPNVTDQVHVYNSLQKIVTLWSKLRSHSGSCSVSIETPAVIPSERAK